MNIITELDLSIKKSETNSTGGHYVINDLNYDTYMANAEWDIFKNDMCVNHPQAYAEFCAGGGGELLPKDGKPPKMASYGSSSRMIYNHSVSIDNFHFEKKLHTTVGGTAHLDGFLEKPNEYVFVEAKCHEPYSHGKTVISGSYSGIYDYINNHMNGSIKIEMTNAKKEGEMDVEYFTNNTKLERFDLKQMICHLLGIASQMLRGRLEHDKKIKFIYFLFDPTCIDIASKAQSSIYTIYEKTCNECDSIDFKNLLKVIFEYLIHEKHIGDLSRAELDAIITDFSFVRVSQASYNQQI